MAASSTRFIEIIDRYTDLADIRKEWSEFAREIPHVTPFQMPEWLLTWWPHFGSGELRVIISRKDGHIAGIIPCFRHAWEGESQITLLGSGISDYLEPAIRADSTEQVLRDIAGFLRSEPEWDVCRWQDLNADSPLKDLARFAGLQVDSEPDTDCSEVLLRGTFDEFWASRSKGLRRNVRRYGEKARMIDTPEFRVCEGSDSKTLEALIRLHGQRWQRQGESGMIVANKSANFLRDLIVHFSALGMARLFSLHFQNRIVAVILAFPYRNQLFSYLSAFDPEYVELGFGTALLYESLQYAFQNDFRSWNFLRGSEPYKFLWGAEAIPKLRLTIQRT